MKGIAFVLVAFISIPCLGQKDSNSLGRLTREGFRELRRHRDRFVPPDIYKQRVIVVSYTALRYRELRRQADVKSLISHGIDTTILKPDTIAYSKQEYEKATKRIDKEELKGRKKLKSKLGKLGIDATIAYERDVNSVSTNEYRYTLNLYIVSGRSSPEFGWILSERVYFKDRVTGKEYEVFLPYNYSLFDLMK